MLITNQLLILASSFCNSIIHRAPSPEPIHSNMMAVDALGGNGRFH
jgi:hypothetical protein